MRKKLEKLFIYFLLALQVTTPLTPLKAENQTEISNEVEITEVSTFNAESNNEEGLLEEIVVHTDAESEVTTPTISPEPTTDSGSEPTTPTEVPIESVLPTITPTPTPTIAPSVPSESVAQTTTPDIIPTSPDDTQDNTQDSTQETDYIDDICIKNDENYADNRVDDGETAKKDNADVNQSSITISFLDVDTQSLIQESVTAEIGDTFELPMIDGYEVVEINSEDVDIELTENTLIPLALKEETVQDNDQAVVDNDVKLVNGTHHEEVNEIATLNSEIPAKGHAQINIYYRKVESTQSLESLDGFASLTADPVDGSSVTYGDIITYTVTLNNSSESSLDNIRVEAGIGKDVTFVDCSHDFGGEYTNGIVGWNVAEIVSNEQITLSFSVQVAYKENEPKDIVQEVTIRNDSGELITLTNSHTAKLSELTVTKSADPVSGTTVVEGQTIKYYVTAENSSEVQSGVIRFDDLIPENTSFVQDSIKLTTTQVNEDQLITSYGSKFNIVYDQSTHTFNLTNVGEIHTSNGSPARALQIIWPNGLAVVNESIPSGWNKYATGSNMVYFDVSNNNSQEAFQQYLTNLRLSGELGIAGEIRIEAYYDVAIARFDEDGILHFYKFVPDEKIYFDDALRAAKNQRFNGLQGYLATITSAEENDFLATTVAQNSGWLGGTRFTKYGSQSGNWEWIDGPEKGTQFYTEAGANKGGHALNGQYTNWTPGEPNGAYQSLQVAYEGCLQAFYQGGQWNDLVNNWWSNKDMIEGYYVEFSEGYNGYYLETNDYVTTLPSPTGAGGCKYVIDNGNPYVECISADLDPGESVTMEFEVKVDDEIPETVTKILNSATYENTLDGTLNPGENKSLATISTNQTLHPIVGRQPSLYGELTSAPGNGSLVDINDEIAYTVNISNNGKDTAPYSKIQIKIPEGTQYIDYSATANGTYFANNGMPYIEWMVENLNVSESKSMAFKVTVDKNTEPDTTITATADYGWDYDSNVDLGSQTNTVTHELYAIGDVNGPSAKVSLEADPIDGSTVYNGSTIEYILKVVNTSSDATDRYIYIDSPLPEGTTFDRILSVESVSSAEITNQFVLDVDKSHFRVKIKDLLQGESVTFHFTVKVDNETMQDSIVNTANWLLSNHDLGSLNQFDSTQCDQTTNSITHYLKQPDISASINGDPGDQKIVAQSFIIEYELKIKNDSDQVVPFAVLRNYVPGNVDLNEGMIQSDSGDFLYKPETNEIIWVSPDFQPGEEHILKYTVTVKDEVQDGQYIINQADYDLLRSDPGGLEAIDGDTLTLSTNRIQNIVKLEIDAVETGGHGWPVHVLRNVAGICLCAGIALIAIKKRRS